MPGMELPEFSLSSPLAGTTGLTKAPANERVPLGINANVIASGYMVTDIAHTLQDDAAREESILERIPAARWGQPDDLAGAAVFLASRASDYANGVILPVDGGWLAR